jgi:hypothetical protein
VRQLCGLLKLTPTFADAIVPASVRFPIKSAVKTFENELLTRYRGLYRELLPVMVRRFANTFPLVSTENTCVPL